MLEAVSDTGAAIGQVEKPSEEKLQAARERVELAFLRLQNAELQLAMLQDKHPQLVKAWEAAKAEAATLDAIAKG
jgi:ABC-type transporter Mla subunit MlaD